MTAAGNRAAPGPAPRAPPANATALPRRAGVWAYVRPTRSASARSIPPPFRGRYCAASCTAESVCDSPPRMWREQSEFVARTDAYLTGSALRRLLSRGVDHPAHFGDLGRGKTADLGVLADDCFVLGEIDAERLVVGDIAL